MRKENKTGTEYFDRKIFARMQLNNLFKVLKEGKFKLRM